MWGSRGTDLKSTDVFFWIPPKLWSTIKCLQPYKWLFSVKSCGIQLCYGPSLYSKHTVQVCKLTHLSRAAGSKHKRYSFFYASYRSNCCVGWFHNPLQNRANFSKSDERHCFFFFCVENSKLSFATFQCFQNRFWPQIWQQSHTWRVCTGNEQIAYMIDMQNHNQYVST